MGPFRILETVGDARLAYRLELLPQIRIHPVFHTSLLTLYWENTIEGRKQEPPLPDEVEGEWEYEAEEILDSRIAQGKLQYYVAWKGYGPQDWTWELVENVANSPEVVVAYRDCLSS